MNPLSRRKPRRSLYEIQARCYFPVEEAAFTPAAIKNYALGGLLVLASWAIAGVVLTLAIAAIG